MDTAEGFVAASAEVVIEDRVHRVERDGANWFLLLVGRSALYGIDVQDAPAGHLPLTREGDRVRLSFVNDVAAATGYGASFENLDVSRHVGDGGGGRRENPADGVGAVAGHRAD